MGYEDMSRQELIEKILELENQNEVLLSEIGSEDELQFAWVGNLGRWFWDVKENKVMFNPLKVWALGYDKGEIPKDIGFQYFTDKLHPDDYKKTMQAMRNHLEGKTEVYETEYRIQAKDHTYKWYYDRGRVTKRDQNGKALFLAGIVFDITKKKEMEIDLAKKNEILAELSSIDSLTKLKNHRTLYETLERLVSNPIPDHMLSVAMFDLDDFKSVNDTKGHIHGDQVLKEVADIIRENTRKTDICGRYGGEEFLVVFPNTHLSDAVSICDRIRHQVERMDQELSMQITISGGCYEWKGESVQELIHQADLKLYEAKQRGKNQIRY